METVLTGLQWDIHVCLIHLDDVIVFGKSFEDMLKNLSAVFERMQTAGLKLKARKCKLFSTEVEYLSHVVSKNGVATDPKKIDAVKTWLKPSNVSELHSFLVFCGYYRRYIANFSEIARPLHKLTEKGKMISWSVDCQNTFERLKHCLTTAPVLAHPDFTKPFILDTDPSSGTRSSRRCS